MAKVLERSLYQTDYYAWTKQQAAELRRLAAARADSTLDLAHLAEEVESLGRSDLATVRSQLRRIIEHLLKLEHSPAAEPRFGWRESVIEARDVDSRRDHGDAAPRGRGRTREDLYQQGRRRAEAALLRHGEPEAARALPATCPYSFDQIVSHDWYPANRHGIVDDIVNA